MLGSRKTLSERAEAKITLALEIGFLSFWIGVGVSRAEVLKEALRNHTGILMPVAELAVNSAFIGFFSYMSYKGAKRLKEISGLKR